MAQTNLTDWPSRVSDTIKRDPKKAGVLVVLVIVLAFLGMRTFGPGKPRRASAAATVAGRTASGAGGPAGSGSVSAAPAAGTRGGALEISPALQKWALGPVAPISRNLFVIRYEYFPLERPRIPTGTQQQQQEEGFWAKLEKSLILQADQRGKRENQIANYKAEAAKLKLQSTMMGPQPKALVNGELVGEGDVVASFRVVKIEARRIIIEREGIRLEIQM